MMKYYTLTRFYNNGKTEGQIVLESEFDPKIHCKVDTDSYDQYLDEHTSFEKAERFIADLKTC